MNSQSKTILIFLQIDNSKLIYLSTIWTTADVIQNLDLLLTRNNWMQFCFHSAPDWKC